jgi:hypothetical protein
MQLRWRNSFEPIPVETIRRRNQNYPNAENIAQLDLPVVKFFVGLLEHSFYSNKAYSTKRSIPIPLLHEDEAKYSRGVRTAQL